jgi:diguanylate cyclase (GGDEF)-like protein
MLLEEVAARLKRSVRPDDTVARLGGDEFVILADCSHGAESAGSIAEKLLLSLNAPHTLVTEAGSHTVSPGASIGISLFPQDGDIPERLLQDADCALYRAKRDGRACYRFFDPGMRTDTRAA